MYQKGNNGLFEIIYSLTIQRFYKVRNHFVINFILNNKKANIGSRKKEHILQKLTEKNTIQSNFNLINWFSYKSEIISNYADLTISKQKKLNWMKHHINLLQNLATLMFTFTKALSSRHWFREFIFHAKTFLHPHFFPHFFLLLSSFSSFFFLYTFNCFPNFLIPNFLSFAAEHTMVGFCM